MARAGLVEVADASFEKDGRRIESRKVRLTSIFSFNDEPGGRKRSEPPSGPPFGKR
jgi:hypothetical protein